MLVKWMFLSVEKFLSLDQEWWNPDRIVCVDAPWELDKRIAFRPGSNFCYRYWWHRAILSFNEAGRQPSVPETHAHALLTFTYTSGERRFPEVQVKANVHVQVIKCPAPNRSQRKLILHPA